MTQQALANAWAWLVQAGLEAERAGLDRETVARINNQAAQVKSLHERVTEPRKERAA